MESRIAAVSVLLLMPCALARADQQNVQVVCEVAAQRGGGLYTSNRPPLLPSRLIKLPIGAITPKGWLRRQLELERDGMTGHLAEISSYCKFEGNAWASPQGQGHSPWEDLPYWLKGYGDLGYVLKDEATVRQARRWIDAMLAGQATSIRGRDSRPAPGSNSCTVSRCSPRFPAIRFGPTAVRRSLSTPSRPR